MDQSYVVALLACALALSPLSIPLTLYITHRFGLVGGTPRELVAAQLQVEQQKAQVEAMRADAMREEIALRKEKHELEREMRRAQVEASAHQAPRRTMNPAMGLRG